MWIWEGRRGNGEMKGPSASDLFYIGLKHRLEKVYLFLGVVNHEKGT